MIIAQGLQQVITYNTTPTNGYALTMQIRKWLKEEGNVNMETELSKFCYQLLNKDYEIRNRTKSLGKTNRFK